MSLSSFLLTSAATKDVGVKKRGKEKAPAPTVDDSLDAVFRNSATASSVTETLTRSEADGVDAKASKRKRRANDDQDAGASSSSKRSRAAREAATNDSAPPAAPETLTSTRKGSKASKPKGGRRSSGVEETSASDAQEAPSLSSPPKSGKPAVPAPDLSSAPDAAETSEDEDDEGDPSTLVHESVANKATGARKAKFVPEGETPEQRDRRTIFIGNVPLDVVKSRPLQKQLKRHILSFVPTAKIESVRFRSIAFQKPTAKLPSADDGAGKPVPTAAASDKHGRAHDRERAASWRDAHEDAAEKADEKKFLTPAQKKRVAIIKGELHAEAQSVHAYIVFAHRLPHEGGAEEEDSEPAAVSRMDPFEAAQAAVSRADGSVFMERTLRVDHVGKRGDGDADAGDPKRTVFVGNLDFASKEEDLRVFFEGLVAAERGPPPAADAEDPAEPSGAARRSAWVTRVRIVRDKDTQLGKGFAYVLFMDRECVDEVLNMEEQKLKFAKRKLRVERCKTVPGGAPAPRGPVRPAARSSGPAPADTSRPRAARAPATPIIVPKGDPLLGKRLAGLSKEDRKAAKASDAERVARRSAKKKAKTALVKDAPRLDDRVRVRKRPGGRKGVGSAGKETKKRAVNLAKRNLKK